MANTGDAVEKDLEAYGDEWKGVSVADGKDTPTIQPRPKKSLPVKADL